MSSTEQQTARAFELADRWAARVVASDCVPIGPRGMVWSFCDENGIEVQELEDAGVELQEAVAWLVERGYGSLNRDGVGRLLKLSKELP